MEGNERLKQKVSNSRVEKRKAERGKKERKSRKTRAKIKEKLKALVETMARRLKKKKEEYL